MTFPCKPWLVQETPDNILRVGKFDRWLRRSLTFDKRPLDHDVDAAVVMLLCDASVLMPHAKRQRLASSHTPRWQTRLHAIGFSKNHSTVEYSSLLRGISLFLSVNSLPQGSAIFLLEKQPPPPHTDT